jgi:hypothetical protein
VKVKFNTTWQFRFALGLMLLITPVVVAIAVASSSTAFGSDRRVGLATDWSHRHLVFSTPGSLVESFGWSRNPRYVQQWLRRNAELRHERPIQTRNEIHRDWSQSLGGAAAKVGAGQFPAKYSFDVTTSSCANDFVAFNTGLLGKTAPGGQASIVAFSNLYVGCGGPATPSLFWAYNTGGTITTSVTLSGDGKQLAFVQDVGGVATLALLKWTAASAGVTVTNPTVPTSVTNANYRACSAPCMTTITFSGSPADSQSSPFYDFTPGSDTIYVGDDTGHVQKFVGVFAGTPALAPAPWPVLAASVKLSSPVFDPGTGNVFVTTSYQQSNNSGARLTAICATAACTGVNNGNVVSTVIGTTTPSNVLGPTQTSGAACHGTGASGNGQDLRLDAPLVDSVAGKVYAFLGNDGNGENAVIQFSTTVINTAGQFGFHTCGSESTIGTAATTAGIPVFAGGFDNLYLNSAGASPTGNIYVCGNTSANSTLYQVRITANVLSASGSSVLAISSGSAANTTCSPVSEVDSGGSDLVFLSVQSLGSTAATVNCPSNTGCLVSFSVPTTIGGALPTHTTAAISAAGGSSGIVVDNTVAPGSVHTSQVYYSTLTGATAIQASQAALN